MPNASATWEGCSMRQSRATSAHSRQPVHEPRTLGERAADGVNNAVATWTAVTFHAVWFAVWTLLRLDINLLTMIVSLEAIFLSLLLLISGKRSGQRDKRRDDVEAKEVHLLYRINRQQLALLLLWPIVAMLALLLAISRRKGR